LGRHRVAALADLEPESLTLVEVENTPICVARTESGDVYAINDICSHEEYSLSAGEIWDTEVECPIHGSRFDLRTGRPNALPAVEPVPTYAVEVEGDDVYVNV
jgi:3-phenylpropionate/trans-cinnamate dioxygenase ferredoxin component